MKERIAEIIDNCVLAYAQDTTGAAIGGVDRAAGEILELVRATPASDGGEARGQLRAAYLHGVQEGAQAMLEQICDDYERQLPPGLRTVLWERRIVLPVELRETTRGVCEMLGYPEAVEPASIPVEK